MKKLGLILGLALSSQLSFGQDCGGDYWTAFFLDKAANYDEFNYAPTYHSITSDVDYVGHTCINPTAKSNGSETLHIVPSQYLPAGMDRNRFTMILTKHVEFKGKNYTFEADADAALKLNISNSFVLEDTWQTASQKVDRWLDSYQRLVVVYKENLKSDDDIPNGEHLYLKWSSEKNCSKSVYTSIIACFPPANAFETGNISVAKVDMDNSPDKEEEVQMTEFMGIKMKAFDFSKSCNGNDERRSSMMGTKFHFRYHNRSDQHDTYKGYSEVFLGSKTNYWEDQRHYFTDTCYQYPQFWSQFKPYFDGEAAKEGWRYLEPK